MGNEWAYTSQYKQKRKQILIQLNFFTERGHVHNLKGQTFIIGTAYICAQIEP